MVIEPKETSDNSIQLEVINIDEIIIDTKNRREINEEKVNDLVKSILEIGLIHPITITDKKELIAGFHRLSAYKKLSFKEIPCKIIDESEINQLLLKLIRLDENLVRNEGHYIEKGKALLERKEIYEELYPETKHRSFKGNQYVEVNETISFTKDTANKTGLHKRTIEENIQIAREIIPEVQEFIKEQEIGKKEALLIARVEPQTQEKVIEKLSTGTTNVKIALLKIRREERPKHTPKLPEGVFDVILADPPWSYDWNISESRSLENHYQTMELEDICQLDIPSADNAVLFLWATTARLNFAFKVIEAWGFTYKTSMVWVKDKIGMGYYVRNQHEFVLIATKGSIGVPEPKNRPSSVFESPRTKHSKKPAVIHDLIERMYPNGKYLELFSRETRENWTMWGNEL